MADGVEAMDEMRHSSSQQEEKEHHSSALADLEEASSAKHKQPSLSAVLEQQETSKPLGRQSTRMRKWQSAKASTKVEQSTGTVADAIDAIVSRKNVLKSPAGSPARKGVNDVLDSAGVDVDFSRLTLSGVVMASVEMAENKGVHHEWYILNPRSQFMSTWELLNSVLLMVVAVFTPFEVSFLEPTGALFAFGRLLDGFFLIDMLFQFFLMIPKAGERDKLETRWPVIVSSYLHGWFLLDLASLAACIFDIIPMASGTYASGATDDLGAGRVVRIVRVLRLIKLLRLIKTSRIIKTWSVKMATPRATLTIASTLLECVYVAHLCACLLSVVTIFPPSRLDTWFSTLGYCRPAINLSNGTRLADTDGKFCSMLQTELAMAGRSSVEDIDGRSCVPECTPVSILYLQCFWWSLGLLMGAPISTTPLRGPYGGYFYGPDHLTLLTIGEQVVVILIKSVTAFLWTTVIARFVRVYNNLNPDERVFQEGWDALNRFVSYFKVQPVDALELRRFYIERAEEARAKMRKKVINDFSPMLQEKFVWKLNKEVLVRVPCFTLVVQRLLAQPTSGMERFLVKVALVMSTAVFVPTERPPTQKLYIVTQGVAIYKGNKRGSGQSWGAEDVFLSPSRSSQYHRAVATTYLHVLFVGADTLLLLKEMGGEYRSAFLLTKLWAIIHATGSAIVEQHRQQVKAKKIAIGEGEGMLAPKDIERRINRGETTVVPMLNANGDLAYNDEGKEKFRPKYGFLHMNNHEIVKQWKHESSKFIYRVVSRDGAHGSSGVLGRARSPTLPGEQPDSAEKQAARIAEAQRKIDAAGGPVSSDAEVDMRDDSSKSAAHMLKRFASGKNMINRPALTVQVPPREAANPRGVSFADVGAAPRGSPMKSPAEVIVGGDAPRSDDLTDVVSDLGSLSRLVKEQNDIVNRQLEALTQRVDMLARRNPAAGAAAPSGSGAGVESSDALLNA